MSHRVKSYDDHVKMSSLQFIAGLLTERMWEPLHCSNYSSVQRSSKDSFEGPAFLLDLKTWTNATNMATYHSYFVFLHNERLNLCRKSLKCCQKELTSRWYQAADFFFQGFWFVFQKEFRPVTQPNPDQTACVQMEYLFQKQRRNQNYLIIKEENLAAVHTVSMEETNLLNIPSSLIITCNFTGIIN